MSDKRLNIIDFLRGLSIMDMMIVHYSEYMLNISISKMIRYSDFAIEGFILLAGFMVGNHYYIKYKQNERTVRVELLKRAFKIIKIHYIMILTISLPLALIMGSIVTKSDTVIGYIIKSLLLLNQVDLLHILPTFIPLFLLAILILYMLDKGYDLIILIMSVIFFIIGNVNPYLFTLGERTIFPVILWQTYFVIGIVLGKRLYLNGNKLPDKITLHFIFAIAIFSFMLFIYFGHHMFPYLSELKLKYNINVAKFPLNYLGLFYRGSLLYLIFCLTVMLWKYIQKFKGIFNSITLFGRHSLQTFVIHVYFVKMLVLTNYLTNNPFPISYIIIGTNIFFTLIVLRCIETKQNRKRLLSAGTYATE